MELQCPDILDSRRVGGAPDATTAEPAPALELGEARVARTREYGRSLWLQLDAVRRYLLQEVAGGENRGRGTAMLPDDRAWRQWADLFANVSSVLAGPDGDQGFGRSEATLVARSHGMNLDAGTG